MVLSPEQTKEQLEERYVNVVFDEMSDDRMKEFNHMCQQLRNTIEHMTYKCREQSLALTNLEQSYLWVKEAVRQTQIINGIREEEQTEFRIERENLMWEYAKLKGTDNIIGLGVCDDYLDWERARKDEMPKEDNAEA